MTFMIELIIEERKFNAFYLEDVKITPHEIL